MWLGLGLCSETKHIFSPGPLEDAATMRGGAGAEGHQPPLRVDVCSAEDINARVQGPP